MQDKTPLLLEMLNMQQALNDATAGKDWELGYTKSGKLISWQRCIYMECAELIDSFAWKHWKNINADINTQNLLVEVVDIWHFILSLLLLQNKLHQNQNLKELAQRIAATPGFKLLEMTPPNVNDENPYEIMNEIERLIHATSTKNSSSNEILEIFFSVAFKCGVSFKALFSCYIGKNVLNSFRQNHGYKEGSYKKIWQGKEDNEVMSQILASGTSSAEQIYAELEKEYKKA